MNLLYKIKDGRTFEIGVVHFSPLYFVISKGQTLRKPEIISINQPEYQMNAVVFMNFVSSDNSVHCEVVWAGRSM